MTKSSKATLTALAFVFVGIVALMNPRCKAGCQTLAEHFIKHGLEFL